MNLDHYRRILAGEDFLFPLSPRAVWHLTGPDAERYLNGQVTCDVTALKKYHASYAAVCTAKGRMEGDVTIARRDDEFFLDADFSLRESLGARLEKFLIADDALFEDVLESWSVVHFFDKAVPTLNENGFEGAFTIPNARFGVPGYDMWFPTAYASFGGNLVEADVVETLRIEHAIPRWGAELTPHTLPPEAGPHMLDAISYTKGCYVGQETIARLKSVGHVNRTLVFLRSESEAFPAPETKLMLADNADKEVGTVTSSGFSPRLEKGMALGYVPRQSAAEGTEFKAGDLRLTVTVPFSN